LEKKLKDDLNKKIKTILSGSEKIKNDLEKENSILNSEELVKSFMDQILNSAWVEEDLKKTVTPIYYLSKKENSYWLMNVNLKILMNIKSGVELIPIEQDDKNTTCLIGYSTCVVPNELLISPGWN
jgi:hypothetical protein